MSEWTVAANHRGFVIETALLGDRHQGRVRVDDKDVIGLSAAIEMPIKYLVEAARQGIDQMLVAPTLRSGKGPRYQACVDSMVADGAAPNDIEAVVLMLKFAPALDFYIYIDDGNAIVLDARGVGETPGMFSWIRNGVLNWRTPALAGAMTLTDVAEKMKARRGPEIGA